MIRRNHLLTKFILACSTAILSFSVMAGPKQMDMRVDTRSVDREALKAERKAYHQWLASERVAAAKGNPLVVKAGADELDAVDNAPKQTPEIVGFSQALTVDVEFGNINLSRLPGRALSLEYGALKATDDGGYVYTTELSSPGAVALRVQFAGFNMPTGAALFLYTQEGQVFGPYSGRGPMGNGKFESNTLAGDSITLQVRQTGKASERAMRETRFKIVGLGHIRPRFMAGECGYNADCVVNAACSSDSAVSDAEKAVAHMLFRSGGSYYICSGGLINDNDNSNSLPLFLTANHCISKGREANSLENFFQFASAVCNDTSLCTASYDSLRSNFERTLGASIVSTGRAADYTLLRLSEAAPPGSAFLGWNATPVAYNNGDHLYRISHPQGAPQSFSEHVVDTDAGTCSAWPRGDRIYSRDEVGATEGGSSGSPVVNSSGEIVGQLSGACGTNLNDTCDTINNATVDGAFAAYFGAIEQFLDPGNGGSCTATESPEVSCTDSQDNDCDGDTDAADSDCLTGGLPRGEACQVNSECASNSCKGKPGSKTCK